MATTTQEFYYEIANTHNIANLESVIALDSVDGEEGQSLTDKSVLGEDEAVFFKRLLKIACGAIYKRIHRRGRGVTDPYQFDAEYDSNPGYVIYTLNFPENFDTNLFESVDSQILECMIYHVLAGWFSKARRNYLAEDFQAKYDNAIDELKSIIEMRTLVRRTFVFWDKYYTDEDVATEATVDDGLPVQVTGLTLLVAGWTLVGSYYEYDLENDNIQSNSVVEVVPENEYLAIIQAAVLLPENESSTGSVKLFATNAPTGDIGVTINITESS